MVPVLPTSPVALNAVNQGIQDTQEQTRAAVMEQLYSFLLSQACKGSQQINKLVGGESSLSLASNTALEETFWNQVITTVVQQSQWSAGALEECAKGAYVRNVYAEKNSPGEPE